MKIPGLGIITTGIIVALVILMGASISAPEPSRPSLQPTDEPSRTPTSPEIPVKTTERAVPTATETAPAAIANARCWPAADAIAALPSISPSGQWCLLQGYEPCTSEAIWCAGYFADKPSAAEASILYDCTDQDGTGKTKCVVTSIGKLRR